MSAAEYAEFKAWLDSLDAPAKAQEGGPVRPPYHPSAITFAPEMDAPARVFTAAERAAIGTPVDHRPEHHEGQRTQRIASLMRERTAISAL